MRNFANVTNINNNKKITVCLLKIKDNYFLALGSSIPAENRWMDFLAHKKKKKIREEKKKEIREEKKKFLSCGFNKIPFVKFSNIFQNGLRVLTLLKCDTNEGFLGLVWL